MEKKKNYPKIWFFLIVSYKDFSIKLVHSKRINKSVYCFYDMIATGDRHLGQRLGSGSLTPPKKAPWGGSNRPAQLGNSSVLGGERKGRGGKFGKLALFSEWGLLGW